MPISSGAGGKPNSYFNPANTVSRRASVASLSYGAGGSAAYGNYYYGNYPAGYGDSSAVASPRTVQVMEIPNDRAKIPQNQQASVSRNNSGRNCCPCPSRSRSEMRMPTMPKSKLAPPGGAINRRGCCIFLLGLLALALVAGLIAGLYFLGREISNIRAARGAFYLIPGRRTGDLMWVVYGRTQPCEPVTTSSATTTTPSTTTQSTTTQSTTTSKTTVTTTTSTTTTSTTTTATTLISCADTTFSYVQVTLVANGLSAPGALALCGSLAFVFVLQLAGAG